MPGRTRRAARLIAATALLALVATACGGGTTATDESPTPQPAPAGSALSGSVRLDGSSTVGPLSEVAAELFMQANPDVRVTVGVAGTGGGFEKFCIGETDGNDASRPIKDSEVEACTANDIAFESIQVANDALSIVVNNDFPVSCMTVDQVREVWTEGSTVTVWGDVTGLEVSGEDASAEVRLYGPGTDSGTFDFFTEAINGESGLINTSYTDIGEDDTAAVAGVAGDKYAMAYIPFSYYQEAIGQVKALEIDNGEGCVAATADNVLAGTYTPLGRELYVYFSDVAIARAEVLAFAEFYIDNAKQIAELAGFVPLTDEQIEAQRAKIASLAG